MGMPPAAGSLILQVLAAGVLAVTAGVRSEREWLKRLLLGRFGQGKGR